MSHSIYSPFPSGAGSSSHRDAQTFYSFSPQRQPQAPLPVLLPIGNNAIHLQRSQSQKNPPGLDCYYSSSNNSQNPQKMTTAASLYKQNSSKKRPVLRLPGAGSNKSTTSQSPINYTFNVISFDPLGPIVAPDTSEEKASSAPEFELGKAPFVKQRHRRSVSVNVTVTVTKTTQFTPTPKRAPFVSTLPTRDARAKLLASTLLNRIYAVGRPMRPRWPGTASPTYIPSALGKTSVIVAEA